LKPKLAAQAAKRQRVGKRPSGNLPEGPAGDTRDQLAQHVGMSARTLDKATAVVNAARQDPENFLPVVEEMDRTGKVDAAYRGVKKAKAAAKRTRKPRRRRLGKPKPPPARPGDSVLASAPRDLRARLHRICDTALTRAKRQPNERALIADYLVALAEAVRDGGRA
jgi:hypothetical protein